MKSRSILNRVFVDIALEEENRRDEEKRIDDRGMMPKSEMEFRTNFRLPEETAIAAEASEMIY
jgi:hypothetical protein